MALSFQIQLLLHAIYWRLLVEALVIASTTAIVPAVRLSLTGHPPNQQPSIGDRFTLQCNVWNRHNENTVWFKNTNYIATDGILNDNVMDGGRTVMTKTSIPESNLEIDTLTINNIQATDQANYTCQLWLFKIGTQSEIILSASLNVRVGSETPNSMTTTPTPTPATPTTTHGTPTTTPECASNVTLVPFGPGEIISLSCQMNLTDGMTMRQLYWTAGGKIYEGVPTVSNSNMARNVLDFVMSIEYDDKSFVCHVNQTDGSDIMYNTCAVGPFVFFRPSTPLPTNSTTIINGVTTARPKNLTLFRGYILIIVIIAGIALLCCLACLVCYCCCCRKNRRGEYRFGSRFSVKKKPLVPTSSAASEIIDMSHRHQHRLSDFESPYYSSVGPSGAGGEKSFSDRSAADGASYTALQKVGTSTSNPSIGEGTSGADIVDEDGYNIVGIKVPMTLPSESKLQGSSGSLRLGLSLGSLSRQGSRTSSRASTPVGDEMPYYKTLMRNDEVKTLATPYYLSVFPPAVGELAEKHEQKETKGQESDDDYRASTVPKSVGATKIDRKGLNRNTTPTSSRELLTSEDGYLCPNPKIKYSKSDPKFSNAMYDVFN